MGGIFGRILMAKKNQRVINRTTSRFWIDESALEKENPDKLTEELKLNQKPVIIGKIASKRYHFAAEAHLTASQLRDYGA